ncbi:DUF1830 domain-containing protein [Waterburya agarophytonicola K14]|uniref:DUF1830 domain-containing protein n=1 Tax=Waterburya agarophytonicola KI4 TaxID=2874699 RepID=A0A964FEH8_9CYAN|nr:DUF1830 domain-containing protein [Waterburya agarophytonicola]MCC0176066.1 DUF1830 domain-containing protein [Waterburya agarophytonicola KI4]
MLSTLKNPTQKLAICCYVNTSTHVEIARITNIPHWSFERVIFPGQRLIFEAPVIAKLEIHTGTAISSILSETIDCQKLQLTSSVPGYSAS